MDEVMNSECDVGNDWLHEYQTIYQDNEGIFEVCVKCADEKFWPHDTPNETYLEYNIRRSLQPSHRLFKREYPNFIGI